MFSKTKKLKGSDTEFRKMLNYFNKVSKFLDYYHQLTSAFRIFFLKNFF